MLSARWWPFYSVLYLQIVMYHGLMQRKTSRSDWHCGIIMKKKNYLCILYSKIVEVTQKIDNLWPDIFDGNVKQTLSLHNAVCSRLTSFVILLSEVKKSWRLWVNRSHEFTMNWSTTKQGTNIPCKYLKGCTACYIVVWPRPDEYQPITGVLWRKSNANWIGGRIDWIHKSQNAPVPYPTILHSEQRCAHFCSEWSIVGYGTGAFWDLWIRSIV